MIRRMATVRVAKAAKMKNSAKPPARLFTFRPMWITMVQSTSDNSGDGERQDIGSVGLGVLQAMHLALHLPTAEYMSDLIFEALNNIPGPEYTEEELAFADALNKQSPMYEQCLASGELNNGPMFKGVAPIARRSGGGSSDVADVAHIVPTASAGTATYNLAGPGHSWQITACAGHSIGYKGMLYGGEVVAAAALKMIEEPGHIEKAKEEFAKAMNGKTYKCPIPKEVPIPQPVK